MLILTSSRLADGITKHNRVVRPKPIVRNVGIRKLYPQLPNLSRAKIR
jgi:hypothetical protein